MKPYFIKLLPSLDSQIGGSENCEYFVCIPRPTVIPPLTYTVLGRVSKDAIAFVKDGDELNEEDIRVMWGVEVRKTFRNGSKTHILEFDEKPIEADVEDEATYWGEHVDSAGWNNGYSLDWDVDKVFVSRVMLKCNMQCFH